MRTSNETFRKLGRSLDLGRFRRGVRLILDRLQDWRLNVDTLSGTWTSIPRPGESRYSTWQAAGAPQYFSSKQSRYRDPLPNIPVSWLALRTFVDAAELSSDDIFYDIGCGSGRVLCYVARKQVGKCVGIELSPEFGAKAIENAKRLRGRSASIEVLIGDAVEMDYSQGTVFFFANPFGAETLREVLARIEGTLAKNPRRVRFIYVNGAHSDVMNSTAWLKYTGDRKLMYSRQRAEYWTNAP